MDIETLLSDWRGKFSSFHFVGDNAIFCRLGIVKLILFLILIIECLCLCCKSRNLHEIIASSNFRSFFLIFQLLVTFIFMYSAVPNNSPSPLINFWIFCLTPLSYLDPQFINFPDFVWQIFQRLLKRIVPFAKL